MSTRDVSRGLNQVHLIASICDFLEHPAIREAAERSVPVTMPTTVGGLGFDITLWMGFGIVGLWSALDAYAERAGLNSRPCTICHRQCLSSRFLLTGMIASPIIQALEELDDLRHLFAHNFAGHADIKYFERGRHILKAESTVSLSCGAQFNGQDILLDIPHLRYYADVTRSLFHKLL